MGKQMNRFMSHGGSTIGLVKEQQRTNDLLTEILAELRSQNPPPSTARYSQTTGGLLPTRG